jgi:WD40 repeat protein
VPRFSAGGEQEEVVGCSFFYGRIRYRADGALMAVTSHDFSVQVRDVESGELLQDLPGISTVLDVAFSPDGKHLVATYDDGTVSVWQTSDFSLAATYRAAPGGFRAIAMMPDNATMAVADILGGVALVDVMTGAPTRPFSDATFPTSTMALSADGQLLAVPAADGAIGLWATADGARVATLTGHSAEVTGLAFSSEGDTLASSSSDGTVRTWAVKLAD